MKFTASIALLFASVEGRHRLNQRHAHRHHSHELIGTVEELETQSTSKLVSGLRATLDAALAAEARDDQAAAVAKTAAIKNIQKALTARILKRLDDGQPLVEVARKMKAIEGMQP